MAAAIGLALGYANSFGSVRRECCATGVARYRLRAFDSDIMRLFRFRVHDGARNVRLRRRASVRRRSRKRYAMLGEIRIERRRIGRERGCASDGVGITYYLIFEWIEGDDLNGVVREIAALSGVAQSRKRTSLFRRYA